MKRRSGGYRPEGFLIEKKPRTEHRRYSTISAATSSSVSGDLNFSLRVAKRVLDVDPIATHDNVVCSPLSITAALNILAAGSAGPTREQLLRVMERDSVEEVNDVASRLAEVLKGDDDEDAPDISFANALWVDQRWRLKETFKEVVRNVHKTEARVVDFENQVDEVVKSANLWAEGQTKGLIKQILSRESITEETRMIFANALYFKGVWVKDFDPEDTEDDDFYLLNGNKIRAPFMKKKWGTMFEYGKLKACNCKVLRMLYREGEEGEAMEGGNSRSFSMYIFLPNKKDGLPSLMENIKMDVNLFKEHIKLKFVEIRKVFVPKFSFECDLTLSKHMEQLGLTLPFDKTSCELREIVEDANIDDTKPYVGEVFQKCHIETSEKGTKATVFTRVDFLEDMGISASPEQPPPPIDFVADHPFMFIIREDYSGTILFVGTILDPTSC